MGAESFITTVGKKSCVGLTEGELNLHYHVRNTITNSFDLYLSNRNIHGNTKDTIASIMVNHFDKMFTEIEEVIRNEENNKPS